MSQRNFDEITIEERVMVEAHYKKDIADGIIKPRMSIGKFWEERECSNWY